MPFLILCTCLAISAVYELIEWWTALLSGDAATAFLATQGDVWDTQEDMFMALDRRDLLTPFPFPSARSATSRCRVTGVRLAKTV